LHFQNKSRFEAYQQYEKTPGHKNLQSTPLYHQPLKPSSLTAHSLIIMSVYTDTLLQLWQPETQCNYGAT